jgi:hypothetical protein
MKLNMIFFTCFLVLALLSPACAQQTHQSGEITMPNSQNSAPSSIAEPFSLEYSSSGERLLGENLQKYSSVLRLNSEDCVAFLESHRSQSDEPGEPIGIFQAKIADDFLASILEKIKKTNLDKLPPRTGDGPGSTIITLKFQQGDHKIEQVFSTGDMGILETVRDLLDALDAVSVQVIQYPLAALKVSLRTEEQPPRHFILTLTNIGQEEICFKNPHAIRSDDSDYRVGVQVAPLPEEKPGVTSPPLEWTLVPLAVPEGNSPLGLVTLKPGASFGARTEAWPGWRHGMRFIALGVFSDYTGPAEVDGVYRIRGATFSDALEFNGD